ncbi:MAG: hypothetical protein ACI4R9_00855 [Kiritimatiellia bacterium]
MKKIAVFTVAALAAASVLAQARTRRSGATVTRGKPAAVAPADEDAPTTGKAAKVTVDQFPKTGRASCLAAPSIAGNSIIGACYNKPRQWIVLEAKYTTYAKWQDQLTFTWHVLLETKSASENKGNKEGLPPYSYFTATTTYANIPQGSHAASVCLHPSYRERFGEPKAIGLVITNAKGEMLYGDCESEIKGIAPHKQFWENPDIMNAKEGGEPMIERRQGLLDRAKTIWAMVNPNDYEHVAQ